MLSSVRLGSLHPATGPALNHAPRSSARRWVRSTHPSLIRNRSQQAAAGEGTYSWPYGHQRLPVGTADGGP